MTIGPLPILLAAVMASSCMQRPTTNPNVIVGSLTTGPNNLDPRLGTDDTSQKLHTLMYDTLVEFDDHLRVVPRLAERLDHPDPLTYIAIAGLLLTVAVVASYVPARRAMRVDPISVLRE